MKQTPRASKIFPVSLSSFFPGATLMDPASFMIKYSAQDPEKKSKTILVIVCKKDHSRAIIMFTITYMYFLIINSTIKTVKL